MTLNLILSFVELLAAMQLVEEIEPLRGDVPKSADWALNFLAKKDLVGRSGNKLYPRIEKRINVVTTIHGRFRWLVFNNGDVLPFTTDLSEKAKEVVDTLAIEAFP